MDHRWNRFRVKDSWRVHITHPDGEIEEAEERSELKIQTWNINVGILHLLVVFKAIKLAENTYNNGFQLGVTEVVATEI